MSRQLLSFYLVRTECFFTLAQRELNNLPQSGGVHLALYALRGAATFCGVQEQVVGCACSVRAQQPEFNTLKCISYL